jgi:hypothetical protein
MRHPTLRLSMIPALACCLLASGAIAAGMTDAEKDALRSSCRSDYFSYCSSVPRGPAVLTCLQKNIASVSAGCRQALSNPGGASAPPAAATKAAPAPSPAATAAPAPAAKTAPPPETSSPPPTHATMPSAAPAPVAPAAADKAAPAPAPAAKAAPAAPATPPPAATATPPAPAAPAAKSAAKPPASAPPKTAAPPPPPPPAAAVEPAPVRPLERLEFLRRACGGDARAFCAGVPLGGGRIVECLSEQMPSLSPPCRDALVVLGR